MKKKVIYSGFVREKKEIIKNLKDKYDWNPTVITGTKSDEDWYRNQFKNSLFFDNMDLRNGRFQYSESIIFNPAGIGVLDKLSKYSLNFFLLLEETSKWNFSMRERQSFYYENINFWNSVLSSSKTDIVVFYTWPHNSSDYSLYLVAKYILGIDVLFLDSTEHFNKFYHTIGTDLENLHSPYEKKYLNKSELKNNEDVQECIEILTGNVHKYKRDVIEAIDNAKETGFSSFLKDYMKLTLKTLYTGVGFKKAPVAWKKNKKPFYKNSSKLNYFEYFFLLFKLQLKTIILKKFYESICSEPTSNEKFVFFPAPFQPEANAGNLVGHFQDVFLVMNLLNAALPSGWKIYYKEHWVTFSEGRNNKSTLIKNKEYYYRLMKYKNIKFFSHKLDSLKFIDNCEAVVTVSGTTGWEGLVRNKPTLSFGNSWYMGCKSLFNIKNLKDVKDAFSSILNGFKPDKDDVKRYMLAVASSSKKGLIHSKFFAHSNHSDQNKLIADFIFEKYCEHYK